MKTSVWEKLETKYKPQVINLAQRIAQAIKEYAIDSKNGWSVSEVSDWTDEDLAVSFIILPTAKGREAENIDVTLRLLDAEAWDGTENGTSFACDIVEEGGSIVGGFHPYNYSDRAWVDPTDEDAVEERWQLFESASDPDEIIAIIEQHLKR